SRSTKKRDEFAAFHRPMPPCLMKRIAQPERVCCGAGFQAAESSLWVRSAISTGSQRGRHFRFAPESDGRPSRCKSVAQCHKPKYAAQQKMCPIARLLDHLVGGGKQRRRYGEADELGGLDVDDQLELGRLHHRQVGRLGAFEDAADIRADLPERISKV